jgi:hypothetical protein
MNLTIFTWGYYGWGNATPQLVEAVDAVETGRGFQPPLFVDIRIRRTVRAKGFAGPAFEKLLGPDRHRWMKELGNKRIETKTGPAIQIADPSSAIDLLDLALESARHNQRVLFFCSCRWPPRCHRATVAGLVLKEAKKRGSPIEIVEWPGGEPQHIDLELKPELFRAVLKGRMTIPLDDDAVLSEIAGLPWGSIVTLHSGGESFHRVVGRTTWQKNQWCLPVLVWSSDPDAKLTSYEENAQGQRQRLKLEPTSTG